MLPVIKQIVIGSPEQKRIINHENFYNFQNVIRIQNRITEIAPIPIDESPMAKKFREKRELRDAVKRKQQDNNAPSLTDLMCAICSYKIGITPFNVKDITLFTLYSLLNMNRDKEKYDKEILFLSGGADPKKVKPKYWITNNN